MGDTLPISEARDYAINVFNYFNGKINTVIPAHCLLFNCGDNSYGCLGTSLGDIVFIDLDHIYTIAKDYQYTSKKDIQSFIDYTIIHELLHLNQDTYEYIKTFINLYGSEVCKTIIENACHTKTHYTILELVKSNILEFDIPIFNLFTNINTPDQYQQYLNSYYPLRDPMNKIFELLEYINDYDVLSILQEEPNIRFIRWDIKFRDKFITTDYIYYNNQWLPYWHILNMLRPLLFSIETRRKEIESNTNCYYLKDNITLVFATELKENPAYRIVTKKNTN